LSQHFAYQALIHSTGKQTQEAAWFNSSNECDWKGITCNGNTGTVEKLHLFNQSLDGTIPEDVGLWTGLTVFSVYANHSPLVCGLVLLNSVSV
jgi:hypothetical protein